MSSLWIPDSARREPPEVSVEHRDMTARYNVAVMDQFWFRTPVCQEWIPELQAVDRNLLLGQAKPGATHPNTRPGYYNLLVCPPNVPITVWPPFQTPDGGFMEPTIALLDELRKSDLQNPAVMRERLEQDRREDEAKDRERARDDEERQTEIMERWKAATETQVSMADTGWSQNVDGRRGKK